VSMDKKHRLTLSHDELVILQSYLHHSLDWMYEDTRPDHGLERMKEFKPHVLILQLIHRKLYKMRMR
jgi:hypothetical protein